MDDKMMLKASVRKIGFALITQALILVCSLVTSLIVPKYMGTEQFGYWQIYYFYLNYINLITFGFNDGLVLKYGGKSRAELPIERIRSGNILMCLTSIFVALGGTFVIILLDLTNDMKYIYSMLFLSMPFICVFNIILSYFLAINRQEVYNKMNFLNRFLTTIGYSILLFSGIIGYKSMIVIDYAIRVVIGIACIMLGTYFIIGKRCEWKIGLQEVWENCGHGIFITAGALLASFMPMAGRVVLQNNATIEEYAVFSFALSVLALIVTFTNAAGVVFFPILKNLEENQLLGYYQKIERIYDSLITVGLGMYIPAVLIIKYYLFDYSDVLEYMYLIFALCIPLGKMQMIITPYMKAFRMEKQYFVANLIGTLVMLVGTSLVYRISDSIYFVALTTLIIFVAWNLILELYLRRQWEIDKKQKYTQILLICGFIILTANGRLSIFACIYIIVVLLVFGNILRSSWKKKRRC